MKRHLQLTESYISGVVKGVINEMFGEAASIPYDPNMLDGIDSIDARSINLFIKSMIPEGNRVSVNSPYKAIRQLVLYFSGEGASLHGGRLTKDIVGMMLKNRTLSSIIYTITQEDKKIIDLIYGQNKLTGKPLMQQIVWHLDEITAQLGKFNEAMNSANFRYFFSNTEAMEGSADGKRVGLAKILMKAYMGTNEIKSQIKKMEALLNKQGDPFSYNTGRFKR
jgi:hypothetical protein